MSNNPRDRNLVQVGAPSTQRAQLPGIPLVPTNTDPALARFLQAVKERLEVREGSRGNPWEKTVTKRDLREMGLEQFSQTITSGGDVDGSAASAGLLVKSKAGVIKVGVDEFVDSLRRSRAFKDLMKRLDDPTRFDTMPARIQEILLNSIAEEAAKRGADVQYFEEKLQTTEESLALRVTEVTAAVETSAAGLRDLEFAYATSTEAQAGKITQIEASLGNYYQDGKPGKASLEQEMIVQTDALKGLYSKYQVKVQAGGEFGGFSLSAYEDPNSEADSISQFLIAADKFAIVSPDGKQFPFGVDKDGVYIRGTTTIRDVNGNMVFLANGQLDHSKVKGLGAIALLNQIDAGYIKDPGNLMINGVPLNALKALAFKDKLVTTDINDIGQFVTTTVDGKIGGLTADKVAGLAAYIESKAVTVQALKGGTLFQGDGIQGGQGTVFRLGMNTYIPSYGRSYWVGGAFYSPSGGGVYGESGEFGVVGRGGSAGVLGQNSNGNWGEVGSVRAGVYAKSGGSSPALIIAGSVLWQDVNDQNGTIIHPPNNDSSRFLRGDGAWATGTLVGSDARLKEDVEPIAYGLAEVLKLRPVSYRLKADKSRMLEYGLIAQEVEEVVPTGSSLVFYDPNAKMGDIEGHRVINYQAYIPMLIKAVQELSAEVQVLREEVSCLRAM
jgi:hypothetical protein